MIVSMISKGAVARMELSRQKCADLVLLVGKIGTNENGAVHWIEGRGTSVIVEETIPQSVVCTTGKTMVQEFQATKIQKNWTMVGSIGDFNIHTYRIQYPPYVFSSLSISDAKH